MSDRAQKVSHVIQKEVSQIIRLNIRDPRLSKFLSIVAVDLTKDLRHATVYVSILGSEEDISEATKALKSASGYIRRELGKVLSIRYIPELHFKIDKSIEHGVYMSKKISEVMDKDKKTSGEKVDE